MFSTCIPVSCHWICYPLSISMHPLSHTCFIMFVIFVALLSHFFYQLLYLSPISIWPYDTALESLITAIHKSVVRLPYHNPVDLYCYHTIPIKTCRQPPPIMSRWDTITRVIIRVWKLMQRRWWDQTAGHAQVIVAKPVRGKSASAIPRSQHPT